MAHNVNIPRPLSSAEDMDRLVHLQMMNLTEADMDFVNPLAHWSREHLENPALSILRLMRKTDYIYFTCKHILNIKLLPYQQVILQEMWNHAFPMLICSRGAGKSWLLAVYAILRALFMPGRKIVVTGSGFRQAKTIMNYAETIWRQAPILRSMVSTNSQSGPHHDTDRWVLRIEDSTITALPMGTGDKIRGERAHDILGDEFASIPRDIYETVVAGFGVVELEPFDKVLKQAEIELYKKSGVWNEDLDELVRKNRVGNQSVISGTAYYQFNHFAEYWRIWKGIIHSKGDPKKLRAVFGRDPDPDLDYRDYAIIRLPVDLLPAGYMDERHVARSRATVHTGVFVNEFGACVHPDTHIITNKGVKKIRDIQEGDLVLTHKGRFRKVTQVLVRNVQEDVIKLYTESTHNTILITKDHPVWRGEDDWEVIDKVEDNLLSSHLTTLSEAQSLPIPKEYQAITYPTPKGKPHNPNSPSFILSHDLGKIVGHFARNGLIDFNATYIHFNGSDRELLDLQVLLFRVFKLEVDITHQHSPPNKLIVVTRKDIIKLIQYICPLSGAYRTINPDVLWSNPDFLRGFIIGYMFKGHYVKDDNSDYYTTIIFYSLSLAVQVNTALSYFGISSSLRFYAVDADIRRPQIPPLKSYVLKLYDENRDKFFRLCSPDVNLKEEIKNGEGGHTFHKIQYKDTVFYDGAVYNLEVEEDNSYSLINGVVHNCFSSDTNGFFKRSLVESCVTQNPIMLNGHAIQFRAMIRGNPNGQYVFGVDPASEQDKFSIIILELHEDHQRIVYCWTTDKTEHRKRIESGITVEQDFYGFCSRKIRDLMKIFPCVHIALDSGGGGIAIREALNDVDKLNSGETQIWEIR